MDDLELLGGGRVADDDLHEEAVALGLGQRVDALGLDRVLRGEHEERLGHVGVTPPIDTWCSAMTSSSADCTLAGARLISSASTKLAKTGPELDVERLGRRPVDAGADDVGGQEVGGELEAGERAADDGGQRLDGERLGQARDAFEQQWPRASRPDEQPLDGAVLADDDLLDLEEGLLEEGGLGRAVDGRRPGWADMRFILGRRHGAGCAGDGHEGEDTLAAPKSTIKRARVVRTARSLSVGLERRRRRNGAAVRSTGRAVPFGAMRVLVVDDEVDLADAVARGLRREGYAVDVAYDGDEALDKVLVNAYDLICLDITMPGIDGRRGVPPAPGRRHARSAAAGAHAHRPRLPRRSRGRSRRRRRRLPRQAVRLPRARRPGCGRCCVATPGRRRAASTSATSSSTRRATTPAGATASSTSPPRSSRCCATS